MVVNLRGYVKSSTNLLESFDNNKTTRKESLKNDRTFGNNFLSASEPKSDLNSISFNSMPSSNEIPKTKTVIWIIPHQTTATKSKVKMSTQIKNRVLTIF